MDFKNIYSLFVDRVEKFRSRGDVFYVRSEGGWQGISWDVFDTQVHEFASALLACGLKRGDSVCILMGNVPEWPISDIGTIAAGGVGVGLYPTSSAEQCQYIIDHSDAAFVVVPVLCAGRFDVFQKIGLERITNQFSWLVHSKESQALHAVFQVGFGLE